MQQSDSTKNKILALHKVVELEFKQAKAGIWEKIKFHLSFQNQEKKKKGPVCEYFKQSRSFPKLG